MGFASERDSKNLDTIAQHARLEVLREKVWSTGLYQRMDSAIFAPGTGGPNAVPLAPQSRTTGLVGVIWWPGIIGAVGVTLLTILDQAGSILGQESVPAGQRWTAILPIGGKVTFAHLNPGLVATNYVVATHFLEY